jgi:hypothetical protein
MQNPNTPFDTSKIAAATAGMIADLDGLKKYNRNLVDEFRANGGKVSGLFGGLPVLLTPRRARRAARVTRSRSSTARTAAVW